MIDDIGMNVKKNKMIEKEKTMTKKQKHRDPIYEVYKDSTTDLAVVC